MPAPTYLNQRRINGTALTEQEAVATINALDSADDTDLDTTALAAVRRATRKLAMALKIARRNAERRRARRPHPST